MNRINARVIGILFVFAVAALLIQSCSRNESTNPAPTAQQTSQFHEIPMASTAIQNHGNYGFYIGEHYGGGIIFWIDATRQHGFIAAESDQGYNWWGGRYYLLTGANGTAVGTGSANTQRIIQVQGRQYSYAALLCANYGGGGFADWFLPSKDELYLLYQHKNEVGGFIRGAYWSSSEFDHTLAWTKFFYNDNEVYSHRDRFDGVRAIRAF